MLLETPANPTLELVDVRAVAAAARSVAPDVVVVVDSTFATPVLQQPLSLGADLVLHSATKFIGGHGDAMGGVVAVRPGLDAWLARLRTVRALTGALLHPLGAYLLHRGLATLPLRVARAAGAARPGWRPRWPSTRPSPRCYTRAARAPTRSAWSARQMAGPGSVLAVRLHGGLEAASEVARSLRLITHAVSLGGVDTLVQHPAALTHRPVQGDARPDEGLLRLSVGLEDPTDLLADLVSALDAVAVGTAQRG